MPQDDLAGWELRQIVRSPSFDWVVSLILDEVTPPMEDEDQAVATDALSALLLAVPGIPPWKTAEHRKTGTTGQPSAQFLLVSTTGGKVAALETQATR